MSEKISILNGDCMDLMASTPDKYYDLAICDPPYGGAGNAEWDKNKRGRFGGRFDKYEIKATRTGGGWAKKYQKENSIKHWDVAPDEEYFNELFRISKNQIIWGGNYFGLPATRCFLIWRKLNIPLSGFSMAPCEYAWTSFKENAAMFECISSGGSGREDRFHPTQKPIKLYEWILNNYAKENDKILDTHLGSGSIAIAVDKSNKLDKKNLTFVGIELDENYYKSALNRFEQYCKQGTLSF